MLRHSVLAVFIAAVVQAGCGSDSPTGPIGGGNNTYSQTVPGTVDVFSETRHPLSVPVSGNMVLRLTWADGTVDLDLYLTAASCSVSLYPLNNCTIVAQSVAPTGTTETIARSVTAGQQYQIWIDNLSPTLAMNYTLSIDID